MADQTTSRIPAAASTFGYLGALPFAVGATAFWLLEDARALAALAAYGAIILSFMGGVRWGLAMTRAEETGFAQLGLSIAPAFVAWAALLTTILWPDDPLAPAIQLLLLTAAFAGLLWSDLQATRRDLAPAWYPGLRIPLTVIVLASLAVALARVLVTQFFSGTV